MSPCTKWHKTMGWPQQCLDKCKKLIKTTTEWPVLSNCGNLFKKQSTQINSCQLLQGQLMTIVITMTVCLARTSKSWTNEVLQHYI